MLNFLKFTWYVFAIYIIVMQFFFISHKVGAIENVAFSKPNIQNKKVFVEEMEGYKTGDSFTLKKGDVFKTEKDGYYRVEGVANEDQDTIDEFSIFGATIVLNSPTILEVLSDIDSVIASKSFNKIGETIKGEPVITVKLKKDEGLRVYGKALIYPYKKE